MVVLFIVWIQGVLCVDEYDFSTRVPILARQLSSDWKNSTEYVLLNLFDYSVFIFYCFGADILKRLLTHHKVCGTAGFSLCGTLHD